MLIVLCREQIEISFSELAEGGGIRESVSLDRDHISPEFISIKDDDSDGKPERKLNPLSRPA